ncbi:OmpA/MotB family protein [Roseomonas harenae]|uniref:OmpA/MotB family protein n=1 Tax=Muricoccus harenae TaxID=2692566 RepID=UPI001331233B|nr:hypothetical protein [Roseomonas harenae]
MRGKANIEEEPEGYLVSVSDLMAGLLFVFIVALFAFALHLATATGEAERQRAEAEEHRVAREAELDMVRRTAEALEARRVQVEAELEAMRRAAQVEVAALRAEVSEGLGVEVRRLDEALGRARALRTALLSSLQDALERRGVPVTLDARTGVLRLSDRILYASGRSDLPAGGPAREAVRALADALATILPCFAASAEARADCVGVGAPVIDAVFIEGHTDRRRLGTGERDGNYELSANRALNTYAALQAVRPELWELRNAAGVPLMGVSGYGPDRPVPGRVSDREEDLAANRRIEVRFLLAAPGAPDLDVLRERVRQFSNGSSEAGGAR